MKRTTTVFRTFVAGGAALALVMAVAPVASANDARVDHKSEISIAKLPGMGDGFLGRVRSLEAIGNGLDRRAQELAKKQTAKSGSVTPALAAAMLAFKSSRSSAIATFEASAKSSFDAYKLAIAPALVTLKTAMDAAKATLQSATHTRESARDAYKAAVKAANEAFQVTTKNAQEAYKAALLASTTVRNAAIDAARAGRQTALANATTDQA
jgi:hypothetical protein